MTASQGSLMSSPGGYPGPRSQPAGLNLDVPTRSLRVTTGPAGPHQQRPDNPSPSHQPTSTIPDCSPPLPIPVPTDKPSRPSRPARNPLHPFKSRRALLPNRPDMTRFRANPDRPPHHLTKHSHPLPTESSQSAPPPTESTHQGNLKLNDNLRPQSSRAKASRL